MTTMITMVMMMMLMMFKEEVQGVSEKVSFSKSASYHWAMCLKVISSQKVVKMR